MTDWLFPPRPQPSLPVEGDDRRFPVRRIVCVGQNYAAHARERLDDNAWAYLAGAAADEITSFPAWERTFAANPAPVRPGIDDRDAVEESSERPDAPSESTSA